MRGRTEPDDEGRADDEALLLLTEDTLPKRNRELFLALQESARYLKCLGVDAAAVGEEYSELPLETVQDLYDGFESVLEENLGRLRRMTISVIENGVRLAMEVKETPVLPKTQCDLEVRESEDCYFLTIRKLRGGDAS